MTRQSCFKAFPYHAAALGGLVAMHGAYPSPHSGEQIWLNASLTQEAIPTRSRHMPHAIRIYETGGPEKMRWEEVEVGAPGPGQVRVRNTAIGLNYIDTYHRGGLYPVPMPAILGSEGAGVVEAVGPRVKNFKVGDRVA